MTDIVKKMTWQIVADDRYTAVMQRAVNQNIGLMSRFATESNRIGLASGRAMTRGFSLGMTGLESMVGKTAGRVSSLLRTALSPLGLVAGGGIAYGVDRLLGRIDDIGDAMGGFRVLTQGSADQIKSWAKQLVDANGGLLTTSQSIRMANSLLQQRISLADIGEVFKFARIQSEMFGKSFESTVDTVVSAIATGRLSGLKQLGLPFDEDRSITDALERRRRIMEAMKETVGKFGTLPEAQVDGWTKLKNSVGSIVDALLLAASQTGPFEKFMNLADTISKGLMDPSKLNKDALRSFFENTKALAASFFKWIGSQLFSAITGAIKAGIAALPDIIRESIGLGEMQSNVMTAGPTGIVPFKPGGGLGPILEQFVVPKTRVRTIGQQPNPPMPGKSGKGGWVNWSKVKGGLKGLFPWLGLGVNTLETALKHPRSMALLSYLAYEGMFGGDAEQNYNNFKEAAIGTMDSAFFAFKTDPVTGMYPLPQNYEGSRIEDSRYGRYLAGKPYADFAYRKRFKDAFAPNLPTYQLMGISEDDLYDRRRSARVPKQFREAAQNAITGYRGLLKSDDPRQRENAREQIREISGMLRSWSTDDPRFRMRNIDRLSRFANPQSDTQASQSQDVKPVRDAMTTGNKESNNLIKTILDIAKIDIRDKQAMNRTAKSLLMELTK